MQVTTNQKEPPEQIKKVRFWKKKGQRSSWYDLAIRLCRLKKINPKIEKVFAPVISVTRQKTNLAPDTGPVKRGEDWMKVEEVLAKLEKHEAECNLRYQRIEERLEDHKGSLKALDLKLWALAVLILIAPFVQRMWL